MKHVSDERHVAQLKVTNDDDATYEEKLKKGDGGLHRLKL